MHAYCSLAYRFHLPYRLFLDDGVYFVESDRVRWRIGLKAQAQTTIRGTIPPIDFGDRSQLSLDSHGLSGVTEVTAAYPLIPSLTHEQIVARQTSAEKVTLGAAIGPINRLIGFYRAKTWEYWFRSIGVLDIPAFTVLVLPENAQVYEWFLTATNVEIASGYSLLKTERWYEDLLSRCERGETVPFVLELTSEGRDALRRDNLRLAASNFALAAEALFRALLNEYFPGVDSRRTLEQMVGTYFGRYRELADPSTLPFTKKVALRDLAVIWRPRDEIMHGHDVDLRSEDVCAAETALMHLLDLWFRRPRSDAFLIEGPFVRFESTDFPSRNVADMLERARTRYAGGHVRDAEEAARFALGVDPTNAHATAMLGLIVARSGRFGEAKELLERALAFDPTLEGIDADLAAISSKINDGVSPGAI